MNDYKNYKKLILAFFSIFAKKINNFIKMAKSLRQWGRQDGIRALLIARGHAGQFMYITLFLLIYGISDTLVPIIKVKRSALRFGSSPHYVTEIVIDSRPTWLYPALRLLLSAQHVSLCKKHWKPCFIKLPGYWV